MIDQKPFAAFLDLITFDQKIHTIQQEIRALRRRLEIASEAKEKLTQDAETAQESMNALRVQITLQEKEMHDIDQQEKAKKAILATLSGYRETKALQVEIDGLKRSQLEYEQLIMQSWNKLEQAQKEMTRTQAAHAQSVKALQEDIATIEAVILQETHKLNEWLQERPEKVAHVPHEWMEHYITMASRVSDPVVPVEQESCSACFTSIAKQDMLRLQRGALLKCKMCFRLLYMPSIMKRGSD